MIRGLGGLRWHKSTTGESSVAVELTCIHRSSSVTLGVKNMGTLQENQSE